MDIVIKTGQATSNMKVLRQEMKSLKDQLLGLDKDSIQYEETLQKLADKTRDLNDLNQAVRNSAADLGQKLNNISKLGTEVAGGFAAVQGAMALFGGESEKLQELMVKLQASIALVNGLKGFEGITKTIPALAGNFRTTTTAVKGFIKGLNGIKGAIVSTGIGALIVALGMLIANWDKISEAMGKWLGIAKDTNDRAETLKTTMEEHNEVVETQNRIYALNHTALETMKHDMDELKSTIDGLKDKVKELNGELDDTKWYQWGKKKDIKAAIKSAEEAIEEGEKELARKEQDLIVEQEKDRLKKIEEAEKAAAERQKQMRQKTYEELKKQQDTNNSKNLAELKVWYNKELAELQESDRKKLISHEQYLELVAELERRYAEANVKVMDENEASYMKLIKTIRSSGYETLDEINKSQAEYVEIINNYFNDIDYKYSEGIITLEQYNEKVKEIRSGLDEVTAFTDNKRFEFFHEHKLQDYADMWKQWSDIVESENRAVEHSTTMAIIELEHLRNEPHMLEESLDDLRKMMGGNWLDIDLEQMKLELDEANSIFIEKKKALEKQIMHADIERNSPQMEAGARLAAEEEYMARKAELEELELAHTEDIARREIEIENRKKAVKEQILRGSLDTASAVFGAMSSLLNKESKAYKISASAQAMIDTYKSANSAYAAMAGIPYVGPALGAASAAAAIAAGIANVKAIWATDERNGSSGSTNVSIPTATAQSPYSYTRNVLTSTEQEQLNRPTKVYVLQSDIEDANNKVRVARDEASF